MIYRFVVYALTHYATSFGNNFGKEKVNKKLWLFLLSILIESPSQYGGGPYHLKARCDCMWHCYVGLKN